MHSWGRPYIAVVKNNLKRNWIPVFIFDSREGLAIESDL